jgi:hypothetical protein
MKEELRVWWIETSIGLCANTMRFMAAQLKAAIEDCYKRDYDPVATGTMRSVMLGLECEAKRLEDSRVPSATGTRAPTPGTGSA